jgi:hypothetical protein
LLGLGAIFQSTEGVVFKGSKETTSETDAKAVVTDFLVSKKIVEENPNTISYFSHGTQPSFEGDGAIVPVDNSGTGNKLDINKYCYCAPTAFILLLTGLLFLRKN